MLPLLKSVWSIQAFNLSNQESDSRHNVFHAFLVMLHSNRTGPYSISNGIMKTLQNITYNVVYFLDTGKRIGSAIIKHIITEHEGIYG
jgi:hypothetical protein